MNKLFFIYPSIIFASIRNSLKVKKFYKIPLITSKKTKIIKKRRSKIILKKRVWLGVYNTRVGEVFGVNTDNTYIELNKESKLEFSGEVKIGPGSRILLGKGAKVEIGSGTEITGGTKIMAEQHISIGKNCMIAWDVQIMDTDWHTTKSNNGNYVSEVIIEDDVWIASGVKIMRGVRIGSGSVIAAGSIINSDVPKNSLFGGIPAKLLKEDYFWKV